MRGYADIFPGEEEEPEARVGPAPGSFLREEKPWG